MSDEMSVGGGRIVLRKAHIRRRWERQPNDGCSDRALNTAQTLRFAAIGDSTNYEFRNHREWH